MERVDFKFKRNGAMRTMNLKSAQILEKLGHGTYMTKVMTAAPLVMPVEVVESPVEVEADLDAMGKEELHELAKQRGVKVHHMAGADKVRAALRGE